MTSAKDQFKGQSMGLGNYVIRVLDSPLGVDAGHWNALLATQADANPFMRHEYLAAMHASGAAIAQTGWTSRFVTLWRSKAGGRGDDELQAACPLYIKAHSYGEYVFDWAWASAYQQHGLDYYPKAVIAAPFTPVPGARLLARTAADREALVHAVLAWCKTQKLSSLHVLFANEDDIAACAKAGLMQRHTVQFHWKNVAPTLPHFVSSLPPEGANSPRERPVVELAPTLPHFVSSLPPSPRKFTNFDDFLASLSQEKRKKIRQERRKVAEAGVSFRWALGKDISPVDWDFFYRCYERTYLEHGNAPYLSRDFFAHLAADQPQNWLLFVAEQNGRPIASSLIAINNVSIHAMPTTSKHQFNQKNGDDGSKTVDPADAVAYGRYWGALERVDCLHFEACYYQPLQWCIDHGVTRFEGGAQGEHKMARALMPVKTTSAHWLAHPAFADAVEKFLAREGAGIGGYLNDLESRSPFKAHTADPSPPAFPAPLA